jgi:hypothetical protein
MKKVAVGIAFAALLVGVAGCGSAEPQGATSTPAAASPSPTPAVFTIHGSITIAGLWNGPGEVCRTSGGYDDIKAGTQVTVTDAAGKVIALGDLDAGVSSKTGCEFDFSVTGVPDGSDFYSVEVAHRGELRYTRADLNSPLSLTLG